MLLSAITLVNLSNPNYNAIPDFFALGVAVVSFIVLVKTKNYRLVGYFGSLSVFIIISTVFFTLKALHYTTPGWMIVNIIFTYFVLDKLWGAIMLIAHFIVFFIYLFYFHNDNVQAILPYNTADILVFVMEYGIIALAIGNLLHMYMRTTNYSEETLTSNNQLLLEQNSLIKKQNEEMEIMLKEIHHRVKNNLQIITSLLRLQAENNNPEHRAIFDEAIDRVNAMAIIHEKIYKSDALSNFDLEHYLVSLSNDLLRNYAVNKEIQVELKVNTTTVYSKSIVPLALLFNELISNSIKHAFNDQLAPRIGVSIESEDDHQLKMVYTDNGKWVENETVSFGQELIEAMTQQMEGSFERIISETGTQYRFELVNLK
ncbi:MAG: sensor histidine kinase [Fluviicola sp.]|nr:sensor histidine kinase [Fluviicola sp.]